MGTPNQKTVSKTTSINNDGTSKPFPAGDKPSVPKLKKLSFFLALISFLIYANTLSNGYVFDDLAAIQKNTIVAKGIAAIPEILSTPYHEGFKSPDDTTTANDLYRPLSLIMFAAERQLSDSSPAASHFMNILFFAGCVVLLFLFLDRLFEHGKTGAAFIAALLFAVHPIHTEVVANIKSRDELLCFFFAFGALILFIKYARTGKNSQLLTGTLCYFLSLLAKETSISFLLVVPLVFFFYINEQRKRSIYLTTAAVIAALAYLAIRYTVLNAHHAINATPMNFMDNALADVPLGASRLATAILVMGYYIRLLFVPYPLLCDYAYNTIPFVSFSNAWVLLALAIYLALIAIGIIRFVKNKKDPYAFGILFFLITIALFSNIVFLIGAEMGERFLFFSSAGFCLVIALLLWQWLAGTGTEEKDILFPKKIWYVIIPVCLIFSVLTIARNADWKDNYTLFKTDAQKAPGNARLWYSVGYEITENMLAGDPDFMVSNPKVQEGIAACERSLSIYPGYFKEHNDLGNLFIKLQQYDSAQVQLEKAVSLDPTSPVAVSDLGRVYFIEKKYPQAIELSKKALALHPGDAGILNNLAVCYLQIKAYDSALLMSKKALLLQPGNTLSVQNIATANKALGKPDSSLH